MVIRFQLCIKLVMVLKVIIPPKTAEKHQASKGSNVPREAIQNRSLDKAMIGFHKLISQLKPMVYEAEIKGQSNSNSNSQNVTFVSSKNTSSTNEAVNTAHEFSTASSQGQVSSSTYAEDVMFSFFANQSNSPQLDNKDLEQIDTDDLEEMDLK
ncbi:hypothetical protein Tco_0739576 [Tanacetum coccineum]